MNQFIITNTNDSGAGSLRQAISEANQLQGTQTIAFDSSLRGQTITLTSGELAITDSVNIEGLENRDIIISGNNSFRIFNVDDGNNDNQIDVNISNVTVTEGNVPRITSSNPGGGAIASTETLTITNSTISNNFTGSRGGGIYSEEGDLTINDSTVSGNTSDTGGGGVAIEGGTLIINNSNIENNKSYSPIIDSGSIQNVDGEATVKNSIISNNQGTGINNFGRDAVMLVEQSTISNNETGDNQLGGGGIVNGNVATITIKNSIVSGNSFGGNPVVGGSGGLANRGLANVEGSIFSNNQGGGIDNRGTPRTPNVEREGILTVTNSAIYNNNDNSGAGIENTGIATITNTTITGNSAQTFGGGITNSQSQANLILNNSTITDNSVTDENPDRAGGIYNLGNSVTIASSIVANNNNGDVGERDGAVFISDGNNLIGNSDGAMGFTDGVNGDIVGTAANPIDPLLGTLQDNGGTTPTIALLTGSRAIDAGSNPLNLTTDQRGSGFPRTIDGDGDGVAVTDIGAFEADAATLPNPPNSDEGELIIGTNGRDSLVGGVGNDTIDGGNGKDSLFGGEGNDELFGGNGKDSLVGNNGRDTLRGGNGSDSLNGSAVDDELFGDSGGDFLVGNSGAEFIIVLLTILLPLSLSSPAVSSRETELLKVLMILKSEI